MNELLIIVTCVIGFILIMFESKTHLDKAPVALFMGTLSWVLLSFSYQSGDPTLKHALFEHFGSIAEILFFLLAAMTIVEQIDAHDGFDIITRKITTKNPTRLLWIVSLVTFWLSAGLDNMTTAIVMCALVQKIIRDQYTQWFFGGFVVIAANAGGAWSPIGDVTTIMLWIGGQVTTHNIVIHTILPSLSCLLLPLVGVSIIKPNLRIPTSAKVIPTERQQYGTLMFCLGFSGLLSIVFLKNITHLPPYLCILFVLAIIWVITELLHKKKDSDIRRKLSIQGMLEKIDTPSILFFLGILLTVSALETMGTLETLAHLLDSVTQGSIYAINTAIGILSAAIDNVPLVAAVQGMYGLETYPVDHPFWELLAYCAGTGGSILIIGSAAGVFTMSKLGIRTEWYIKNILPYAALGYFAGIITYWIQH